MKKMRSLFSGESSDSGDADVSETQNFYADYTLDEAEDESLSPSELAEMEEMANSERVCYLEW